MLMNFLHMHRFFSVHVIFAHAQVFQCSCAFCACAGFSVFMSFLGMRRFSSVSELSAHAQVFQGFIAAGAARTLKRFNTEVARILPEIFSPFLEKDFFSAIRPKRYK